MGHLANIATPEAFPRRDGCISVRSTRSGNAMDHLALKPSVRMAEENWRCTTLVAAVSLAVMTSKSFCRISSLYCKVLETIDVGLVIAQFNCRSGPGLSASPTRVAVKGSYVAHLVGKMPRPLHDNSVQKGSDLCLAGNGSIHLRLHGTVYGLHCGQCILGTRIQWIYFPWTVEKPYKQLYLDMCCHAFGVSR